VQCIGRAAVVITTRRLLTRVEFNGKHTVPSSNGLELGSSGSLNGCLALLADCMSMDLFALEKQIT